MGRNYAFEKWVCMLDERSEWSEGEIIAFRKALGHCGFKDPAQKQELLKRFRTRAELGCYRITRQQAVKGQTYLLKNSLKLNGEMRSGCKLGWKEIKILKELDHHLLVGMEPQYNAFGKLTHYLPIYRAISFPHSFEYIGDRYSEGFEVIA